MIIHVSCHNTVARFIAHKNLEKCYWQQIYYDTEPGIYLHNGEEVDNKYIITENFEVSVISVLESIVWPLNANRTSKREVHHDMLYDSTSCCRRLAH